MSLEVFKPAPVPVAVSRARRAWVFIEPHIGWIITVILLILILRRLP